jgi:hypothetical protein
MPRTRSVNDLLSLKKEIVSSHKCAIEDPRQQGGLNANVEVTQTKECIDSMIPICCANGMTLQSAVDKAIAQLEASRNRFDAAASALRASAQQDPIEYTIPPRVAENPVWRHAGSDPHHNKVNCT